MATPASIITQSQLDDASCILCEVRAIANAMIDGTASSEQCGVFGAMSRLITSAKDIIDNGRGMS